VKDPRPHRQPARKPLFRQLTPVETAHDQVVTIHACMRSCYRLDRAALDSIRAAPTDDKSPVETLHRMKEIIAV
jgi:hypothetical protein